MPIMPYATKMLPLKRKSKLFEGLTQSCNLIINVWSSLSMRSHARKDGYHNVGKDKLSIVNHVHNISNFGAEFCFE